MDDEQQTRELQRLQGEREEFEREAERSAPDEGESSQHQRRADKARYLRDKLQERAESERKRDR